jgi:hypothetical protein
MINKLAETLHKALSRTTGRPFSNASKLDKGKVPFPTNKMS